MKFKIIIIITALLSLQLIATSREINLVECTHCIKTELMEKAKPLPTAVDEYHDISPLVMTMFQI
jgi:hypothetical protein